MLLVAPTGRAARRMAESSGLDASTVHSALGWIPGQGPTVDELDTDLLIVDETSMANLELLVTLLRAVGPRTHVVLVGDADQLAPVGAGKPFAELVEAKPVPIAELTHIFRQAAGSMIVRGAHAVRHGDPPSFAASEGMTRDLFLIERADPRAALDEVVTLVTERLPKHFGVDSLTDIQVFAPVYRGALGIDALNARLREALNPAGRPVLGGRLRIGDKLMLSGRNLHDLGLMNGTILRLLEHNEDDEVLVVEADGVIVAPARGGGAEAPARLRLLDPQGPGHRAARRDRHRPRRRGRVLPAPRDALHRDDPGAHGDPDRRAGRRRGAGAPTPDTSRRYSLAERLGASARLRVSTAGGVPDGARLPRRITVGYPPRQKEDTLEPSEPTTGRSTRLILLYVVLRVSSSSPRSSSARARTRSAPSRSRAATTRRRPDACLGAPPPPAKGRAAADDRARQPAVAGPSFDVKQSGAVREPLELPGARSAASCASRATRAPRRRAQAHRRRQLRERQDRSSSRAQRRPATRAVDQRHARRPADGSQPAARPAGRGHAQAARARARSPSLYKLSPRSTCFGGNFELEKASGAIYTSSAKDKELGGSPTTTRRARSRGDVECTEGGAAKLKGHGGRPQPQQRQADPARRGHARHPGLDGAAGKPVLTTPSGLPPAGEKFTATKAARVVRPHRRGVLHRGRGRDAGGARCSARSP